MGGARHFCLCGFSLATDVFYKFGDVTRQQSILYDRLRWVELQLGRLSQALDWHQLTEATEQATNDAAKEDIFKMFDAVLGIELLRTNLAALGQLERMPDVFEEMGLYMAKSALLFALGQPSEFPDTLFAGEDRDSAELQLMRMWRDQPAAPDLRPMSLGLGTHVTLESTILGCRVEVKAENKSPALDLAECLLAALESLLSTTLDSGMAAWEPVLMINVMVSEFADNPFSFRLEFELGRPHLYVACRPFNPHVVTHEEQGELKSRLVALLIHTMAKIVAPNRLEAIQKLFEDENPLDRAVSFTSTFVAIGNVLGHSPKTRIDQWISPKARRYPLARESEWDADERASGDRATDIGTAGSDEAAGDRAVTPAPLRRHTQLRTRSLIRLRLWDTASWTAVGFLTHSEQPPVLALVFQDARAGTEIFEGWREDLGREDHDDVLRISIVRGISMAHPTHYRVLIGSERDAKAAARATADSLDLMVYRINTMEPGTTDNLARFLESYEMMQAYVLAPGVTDSTGVLRVGTPRLGKRRLSIRAAWDVGRHDVDAPAIRQDDDILIPEDEPDAPVKGLLRWLKDR